MRQLGTSSQGSEVVLVSGGAKSLGDGESGA